MLKKAKVEDITHYILGETIVSCQYIPNITDRGFDGNASNDTAMNTSILLQQNKKNICSFV